MPSKKRYAAKRARGECSDCSDPAIPGTTLCYRCRERGNMRDKKWHRRNKEMKAIKSKAWRQRAKEQGKCIRCGAPMDSDELTRGYVTCHCNNDKRMGTTKNHPY